MEDENVQENKSAKRKCNSSHEEIYMPQTKRRASNRKDSQVVHLVMFLLLSLNFNLLVCL